MTICGVMADIALFHRLAKALITFSCVTKIRLAALMTTREPSFPTNLMSAGRVFSVRGLMTMPYLFMIFITVESGREQEHSRLLREFTSAVLAQKSPHDRESMGAWAGPDEPASGPLRACHDVCARVHSTSAMVSSRRSFFNLP